MSTGPVARARRSRWPTTARVVDPRAVGRHPGRRVHRDRRAQRLRQVHAAAGAGADAQAERRQSVLLDGAEITSLPTKQVARRLGLLPQSSIAPDGITVADLVARGRHPYQRLAAPVVARGCRGAVERARWCRRASTTSPSGWWTSCRAGSASACGWRWRSRRPRRCCCSMSRRRSWTSPIRWRSRTCAQRCMPPAVRWSRSCTTSTTPAGTRRT